MARSQATFAVPTATVVAAETRELVAVRNLFRMREDVGDVTTSLHRPVTDSSRSKPVPYDSFEWQQEQPPSNGVPRSAWNRTYGQERIPKE